MNEQDLVTLATDSLSGATDNVQNPNTTPEAGIEAFADAFLASEGLTDESQEQTEVAEESATEEHAEEIADDSNVEAEETTQEAEDTDLEVNEEAEIGVLSYQDLFDQVGAVEINGETYTPAQLKSILGQEVSAGKKAREATDKLKEIEARTEQLAQQEQWLQQRSEASKQNDQLVQMQAEARKINASIEQARAEGDMYELTVQKDKLEALKGQYNKVNQQVAAVKQQEEAQMYQKAEAGLKDLGMGYLLQDNADSKAWMQYASSSLSANEVKAVTLNPQLASMVEKARKWDAANGKQGKKLTSKSPTLKTAGSNPSKIKQQRKQLMSSEMAAGRGNQNDALAGIESIARELFSGD